MCLCLCLCMCMFTGWPSGPSGQLARLARTQTRAWPAPTSHGTLKDPGRRRLQASRIRFSRIGPINRASERFAPDVGCWMLDVGSWLLAAGCKIGPMCSERCRLAHCSGWRVFWRFIGSLLSQSPVLLSGELCAAAAASAAAAALWLAALLSALSR